MPGAPNGAANPDGFAVFFCVRGVGEVALRKGAVVDDVAVFHGDHALGACGEGLFVGDHDDGLAAFGDLLEDIGDEFGVSAIEVSGGFVGEEDGGFVGECAGDGDALLFAAGEAIGFAFEFVGEAEIFEEVCSAVHGEWAFESGEFEHWESDVFLGGEFLEEVMELEDEADFLVAEDGEFEVAEGGGVGVIDEDSAGWLEGLAVVMVLGGSIEAAEEVEEGAFPGATGSYDGDVITAGDIDGDAFEDVGGGFA